MPGYRGAQTAAVASHGTGLGLYVANRGAQALSGELSYHSDPESDLITFVLALPMTAGIH
jgi:signal transduction histidine kinase